MIAIDTNVLVRYLVHDDAAQAEAARELLEDLSVERPGFICREVMVEVVWVLDRAYGFARGQIATVVDGLVTTASLVVEEADAVAKAAARYGIGGPDFADLMILAAADRSGARRLYTFDRRLSRLDGAGTRSGLTTRPTSTSGTDTYTARPGSIGDHRHGPHA